MANSEQMDFIEAQNDEGENDNNKNDLDNDTHQVIPSISLPPHDGFGTSAGLPLDSNFEFEPRSSCSSINHIHSSSRNDHWSLLSKTITSRTTLLMVQEQVH